MEKKYTGITGLRGITACLIAYVFHYLLIFYVMPVKSDLGISILSKLGYILLNASDVFFVMSGFLLARKYENKPLENFGKYMSSKVKKIYPLMIFTAIVVFVAENVGLRIFGEYPLHDEGGHLRYSIQALILNVTGLQTGIFADGDTYATNGPSWFITVILICQILLYIILKNVKKEKHQNLIFVAFIVIGVITVFKTIHLPLLYSCVGRGYIGFFAGVLMRRAIAGIYEKKQKYQNYIKEGSAIIAALLAVLFLYLVLGEKGGGVTPLFYVRMIGFWVFMTYLVVYGFLANKFFGVKVFQWLGDRAMVVFLCNIPTDLGIVYADRLLGLNLNYEDTRIWILHIVISLIVVEVMYRCDQKFGIFLNKLSCNLSRKEERKEANKS
jgi:peptidoglycan/LPS O-acetylase OafA/YrhL